MGNHMELSSNQPTNHPFIQPSIQPTNHPNVEQGAESLSAIVPSRLNTTETDQKVASPVCAAQILRISVHCGESPPAATPSCSLLFWGVLFQSRFLKASE